VSAPPERRLGRYVLSGSRVATPLQLLEPGYVVVEGERILGVGGGRPPATSGLVTVDVGDRLIVPGYVDVHVHGGGGGHVNGETEAEVEEGLCRLGRFHAEHGTTSLVATTVSDTSQRLAVALRAIRRATGGADRPAGRGAAQVLGAHLEGPYLSPRRPGAHDPARLRPPDVRELESLLAAGDGTVRLLTLAPELPGAQALIALATANGVRTSLGHTDADYETARAAIGAGIRHATHLFNAMSPLHQRKPGAAAAALGDERVSLELIADGHHVHPGLLALVASCAPGRFVLVSDATAAGLPPGRHVLGSTEVELSGSKVTLRADPDTLAGSALTLDVAVANLCRDASVPLLEAVSAATITPARLVGATGKGRLHPGADADIVVLGKDLAAEATIVRGRPAHDPGGILRPSPD
jgi:N-acetylglucosamine-6-phosphate deacetylase